MDPNMTLEDLREAISDARQAQQNDTDHPAYCVVPNETVTKIIERFEALDEWLSRKGFRPAAWS